MRNGRETVMIGPPVGLSSDSGPWRGLKNPIPRSTPNGPGSYIPSMPSMTKRCQRLLLALITASCILQTALGSETIYSNSLGLSLEVPDGTNQVGASQPGQPAFLVLREGSTPPRWSLRIERLVSEAETATDLLLDLIGRGESQGSSVEILAREPIQIGDQKASTTWISESQSGGKKVVFGWLVLPTARNDYVVATAITLPSQWETTREDMTAIFSSLSVQDPKSMVVDRESMLQRGNQLVESLTEDDLRKLIGFKELRRIYRDGSGTDTEIGYSLIEVAEAPRGMIKRQRSPDRYSAEEQEQGLLVMEHSRIVADAQRQIYVDLLSLQWMSWDMQREAWAITATRRQGEARATETEVGFRTEPSLGSPRPRLHVIKQDDEIGLRQPYEWVVPEGWLPRPLTGLVSRLIPHQPQQIAFVIYDHTSQVPALTIRTDEWSPDSTIAGRWILESRVGEQGFPTRTLFDRSGNFLRLAQPGGNTIEPSTVADIQRRWDQAGLRTEE